MAISIISGPTVRQNGPALSQVFSVSTTGSGQRLLVAVIASFATTTGTTGITDSGSNTWVKAVNSSHASLQQRVEIWYTITSGSITSLTVTEGASHAVSLIFYEIGGANLVNPIRDTGNGNDATSNTTWTVGTYNRTDGGEILLLHGASSPNITLTTVTPPFNYTTGGIAGGGATTQAGCTVHRIHTTTTGTYGGNATTNLASTNGWAYVIINSRLDATAVMPVATANSDTGASSTGTGGAEPTVPAPTATISASTPTAIGEALAALSVAMGSLAAATPTATGGSTSIMPNAGAVGWIVLDTGIPTATGGATAVMPDSGIGGWVVVGTSAITALASALASVPVATASWAASAITITQVTILPAPIAISGLPRTITVTFDTVVTFPMTNVAMVVPFGAKGYHWWVRDFGTLDRTQDADRVVADRQAVAMPVLGTREERES